MWEYLIISHNSNINTFTALLRILSWIFKSYCHDTLFFSLSQRYGEEAPVFSPPLALPWIMSLWSLKVSCSRHCRPQSMSSGTDWALYRIWTLEWAPFYTLLLTSEHASSPRDNKCLLPSSAVTTESAQNQTSLLCSLPPVNHTPESSLTYHGLSLLITTE